MHTQACMLRMLKLQRHTHRAEWAAGVQRVVHHLQVIVATQLQQAPQLLVHIWGGDAPQPCRLAWPPADLRLVLLRVRARVRRCRTALAATSVAAAAAAAVAVGIAGGSQARERHTWLSAGHTLPPVLARAMGEHWLLQAMQPQPARKVLSRPPHGLCAGHTQSAF
eukprot:362077-Chlamydomonas_euryale.AAC.16